MTNANSFGLDAAAIASTPSWFPFVLDVPSDRVLLVRKTEAEYRAAAFLDQRSLRSDDERTIVPWSDLAALIDAKARRDAQFIFHIGHVGSTLISRLLGELNLVLALREPLILRTMAEQLGPGSSMCAWSSAGAEQRLDLARALFSRTFRPEQRALVKATSFVSEIADRLPHVSSRALFLYVGARRYLETILAGDASREELRVLAPVRLKRLRSRCPDLDWSVHELSEAQQAAMSWVCEMTSLDRAGTALGECALWLDFDTFLSGPVDSLSAVARFLQLPAEERELGAVCRGPLMRRYAKALEYEYSPELRREVLADARRRHGRSIEHALAWIAREGQRWPAIARVLSRAG